MIFDVCKLHFNRPDFGEGNGNPFHYSHLGNPVDRGDWWATVQGIIKGSDTT